MLFSSLSFAAAAEPQNNHKIKTAHKVKVHAKTVSKKSLAKYRNGKGTGDCWTNSAILYNQLKKTGKKVRIIQYKTSLSPRHRSIQVYQNGRWVDYNYKANGYAKLYYATKSKPGVHVVK
jgi:hypothetical protein